MTALLNISTDEQKPFYADMAKVTVLSQYDDILSITHEDGLVQKINCKSESVDIKDVVQKLADVGSPMFSLSSEEEAKKSQLDYVLPSALLFLTVSKAAEDGSQKVMAGVKGSKYYFSNDKTRLEELQILLDAVRADADKTILEYTTGQVTARWNDQAFYIDPKEISRINEEFDDDGNELYLSFEGISPFVNVRAGDDGGRPWSGSTPIQKNIPISIRLLKKSPPSPSKNARILFRIFLPPTAEDLRSFLHQEKKRFVSVQKMSPPFLGNMPITNSLLI